MFKLIGIAIKYAPIIMAVVGMVEGIVSKDTSGEAKKELVLDTALDILRKFGVRPDAQTVEFIGQIVDAAVYVLNKLGIFQHKEATTPQEDAALKPVQKDEAEAVARDATEARLDELEGILKR